MHFKNRLFFILRSNLKDVIIDDLRSLDLLALCSSPLQSSNCSICITLNFQYFWTWIRTKTIGYLGVLLDIWVWNVLQILLIVFWVLAGFFSGILSIFLIMLDLILNMLYSWYDSWSDSLIIDQVLNDGLIFYFDFEGVSKYLINFWDCIALFRVTLPKAFQLFVPFSYKIGHILKHLILTIDNILLSDLLLLLLFDLQLQKHRLLHECLHILILRSCKMLLFCLQLFNHLILLIESRLQFHFLSINFCDFSSLLCIFQSYVVELLP